MSQLKYQMVAQVHAKLVKDAASPYSPLRKLVCQANMLDRLYLEYRAEVKQQQEEHEIVELESSSDEEGLSASASESESDDDSDSDDDYYYDE
ncbi:hypothetical protein DIURU_001864 [Diutina rugosa]|uniref:Uncharacterized protein n=1 Tax=Diutina rugosa TaxID=5481 RepID=A0A642USN2_DIURU|nr:uncharacterized protein DIURU_001864 [Diutina rugosa]KAA8904588.1 hypothetical protein DIURU_001864 [Diutina rugosa]